MQEDELTQAPARSHEPRRTSRTINTSAPGDQGQKQLTQTSPAGHLPLSACTDVPTSSPKVEDELTVEGTRGSKVASEDSADKLARPVLACTSEYLFRIFCVRYC